MTSHTRTWPSVALGWACLSFVTCGRWQKIHMWKIFSLHQSVWEDSSKPVFVTPGFGKGALHCPSRCCPLRIAAFQREAKKRWQERRCLMSHPRDKNWPKGQLYLKEVHWKSIEKWRKNYAEMHLTKSNQPIWDTIVRLNFFIPPIQSQWHPLRLCVRPRRIWSSQVSSPSSAWFERIQPWSLVPSTSRATRCFVPEKIWREDEILEVW